MTLRTTCLLLAMLAGGSGIALADAPAQVSPDGIVTFSGQRSRPVPLDKGMQVEYSALTPVRGGLLLAYNMGDGLNTFARLCRLSVPGLAIQWCQYSPGFNPYAQALADGSIVWSNYGYIALLDGKSGRPLWQRTRQDNDLAPVSCAIRESGGEITILRQNDDASARGEAVRFRTSDGKRLGKAATAMPPGC